MRHRRAGELLGQLHVGLVKWVDPEDRPREGDPDLPAEELLTDVGRLAQGEAKDRMPGRFETCCVRRELRVGR